MIIKVILRIIDRNHFLLETNYEKKKFKKISDMENYVKEKYNKSTNILVLDQLNKKIKYPPYSFFLKCFKKNKEKIFEKVCKTIDKVNKVI